MVVGKDFAVAVCGFAVVLLLPTLNGERQTREWEWLL